jgi:hypothetical protein
MSSRQEEKERRRREREEQERKASAGTARTRRLQIVGGAVLVIAIIAVAVALITSGGSDDTGGDGGPTTSPSVEVTLPAQKIKNLDEAAKAAGCTLRRMPNEGSTHVTEKVKYKSNPPTSGNHNPTPAADGVYEADGTPEPENYVHSLEHGRIELQYKPGSSPETVGTLEALFNEEFNGTPGYHALVFQNNTDMPYAVAATAWTQLLGCDKLSPEAIDAIRAFRERYTDKAPEFVP